MNIEKLRKLMTAEMLMGPNSLRILEELVRKHPLNLTAEDIVLDLGCGKGLTSLAAAKETPAKIYACDLWIAAEENEARFAAWGIGDQVTPFHQDANEMQFEKNLFQAMVSVDAYHYFGTGEAFFAEKILPFLKDRGEVLIGIPGMKTAFSGRSEELMSEWLGDEAYMFKSPKEWKNVIGTHERIAQVETWEMDCFDLAWDEWFASGHEYADGDKQFFETLIKPYSCFVGIYIKLK